MRLMLLLVVVLACVAKTTAHAERRVALLIGNGHYASAPLLPNPANDASVMAQSFRNGGFDVVEARTDLDRAAMIRALRDFEEKAAGADIGVVFFSGHGMELNGQNYLLPVDAKLESDRDVEDETVGVERFLRTLEGVRGLKLVILDACRDNPFLTSMKRRTATRSIGRGLARFEPTASETLIAYASRAGSVAADGDGSNSPFTTALAKHLLKPGLDVRIALGSVRDDVLAATGSKQEPYFNGSVGAGVRALVPEVVLTPPPPPPVKEIAPPPSVASCHDAAIHWAQAKEFNQVTFYELHLKLYGDCNYAEFARAKIEALKSEAARPVAPPPAPVAVPPKDLAILMPPPVVEPPPPPPPAGPTPEIIRSVRGELKRLGCALEVGNETWSKADDEALKRFVKASRVALRSDELGPDALNILKLFEGRICPPTCAKGEILQGDRCMPQIVTTCPTGSRRDGQGRCVDAERDPAAKETPKAGSRNLADLNPAEMTKEEAVRELSDSGCITSPALSLGFSNSPIPTTKRYNFYRCDALKRKGG